MNSYYLKIYGEEQTNMEYTLGELLSNVQFTDLVNLDKYLKNVTNPKNGRFATIEDVVTEDICKYFVISINIPTEKYIEDTFYQWKTREDIEQFINSCISMRKAAIVFNPACSAYQSKNKNGVYVWCADDNYDFYGYDYKTNKWAGGTAFCTYKYWKKDDDMSNLWDRDNEKYWNPPVFDHTSLTTSSNTNYNQCITRVFDNADEMIAVSKTVYELVNNMINKIINSKKTKLTETYQEQLKKLDVLL